MDNRLGTFFVEGMKVGQLRGTDGAGMYQIQECYSGDVYMDKHALSGVELVNKKEGNAPLLIKDASSSFLTVGHHRHATVGAISDETAHPFIIHRGDKSKLVGVHNGTIAYWGKHEKESKAYAVDSEYLMYRMSIDGIKETLAETTGAIATVVYDSRNPAKFYMYSNGQRPLHFAFMKDNPERMLIASEAEMLNWLAFRNKISLLGDTIYSCKARRLYTFNNSGRLANYTFEDVSYTSTYVPAVQNVATGRQDGWRLEDIPSDDEDYSSWWRGAEGSYSGGRNFDVSDFRSELTKAVKAVLEGEVEAEFAPFNEFDEQAAVESTNEASVLQALRTVEGTISKKQAVKGVTTHELATLKEALGVTPGAEVVFEGDTFWPFPLSEQDAAKPDTIYGTLDGIVRFDMIDKTMNDTYLAEVRNVTEEEAKPWVSQKGYARAMGAYLDHTFDTIGDEAPLELVIVCAKPRVVRAATLMLPGPTASSVTH